MECDCPSGKCLGTGSHSTCRKLCQERLLNSPKYWDIMLDVLAGKYDHLTVLELRDHIDLLVTGVEVENIGQV